MRKDIQLREDRNSHQECNLSEQIVFTDVLSEANIDRDKSMIRNVCVLFRESKNQRFYSDAALDDVIHLLAENGKSFINHSRDPSERDARELAGSLRNPHRDGDKVFADFVCFPHMAEFVLGVAETDPSAFGLSIDGQGEIAVGEGPNGVDLVERVRRLASTDIVAFPASTSSLFEDEEPEGFHERLNFKLESALAERREQGPDLVKENSELRDKVERLEKVLAEYENVDLSLGLTREELEDEEQGDVSDDEWAKRFKKARSDDLGGMR